ncbi:replication factor C subunit 4 [Cimex lectularius]|uniref:Replication factor C subunit 2 n=1 Tax=Cimex lectularius TaxID=79782 RepID=A0A8I6RN63_CIMLE|nr:replication factor C subunit 4 [Cimex lectularius]
MEGFLKTGKLNKEDATKQSVPKEKLLKKPTPWVEKYRPKTVDEVAEQKEIISVLKQCLNGADLPHLLFYGPPGTGKTSTIIAAAHQLFGDMYRERILELNASDDRGIQVIRDKVKNFAQLTASSTRNDGRPCPPFKIIILDEADSMTHAAQAALRRTIEKETKTTRFCLICNYVSCIIPPLTSRCTKFRFKPLGEGMIRTRLEMICKQEEITCEPVALTKLVETSGGDLRRAITCLQSCARLKAGEPITEEDVFEVTGIVPQKCIESIIEAARSNSYDKIESTLEKIMAEAYSGSQILEQLLEFVLNDMEIPDMARAKICEKLSLCNYRLQEGSSEFIQLVDFCCTFAKIYQEIS